MQNNIGNNENCKVLNDALSRAIRAGFFYEAIFLEYAILEDRLTSLLIAADIPLDGENERPLDLSEKIEMIRERDELNTKFIRTRLTFGLMDLLENWKKKRDALISKLADTPYDSEVVKSVAEEGNEIVFVFKNKSNSVIKHLKRGAPKPSNDFLKMAREMESFFKLSNHPSQSDCLNP